MTIEDQLLEGMLDLPNVNDVDRLVAEVRRQRREIAALHGALALIAENLDRGPVWIEHIARQALSRDFRLE